MDPFHPNFGREYIKKQFEMVDAELNGFWLVDNHPLIAKNVISDEDMKKEKNPFADLVFIPGGLKI